VWLFLAFFNTMVAALNTGYQPQAAYTEAVNQTQRAGVITYVLILPLCLKISQLTNRFTATQNTDDQPMGFNDQDI
jgi:phage terminase large subunit-like protein